MKDPQQIKADLVASIEFYRKKDMTWCDLAPYLVEAVEAGVEIPKSGGGASPEEGISSTRYRLMVNCYRFLKLRRPEALKRVPAPPIDNIGRLINLYTKMEDKDKEQKFEEYIDQAISGELSCRKMKIMIREADLKHSGKTDPESDVVPVNKSPVDIAVDQVKALDYAMSLVEIAIENAVRSNGYEKLRKGFAEKCDRVASKLSCIADAEYQDMYEHRRGLSS